MSLQNQGDIFQYNRRDSDQELLQLESLECFGEVYCDESDVALVRTLTNDSSYVGRKLTTDTDVPGNIHKPKYREFWRDKLKPSDLVMRTIVEGYELLFESVPPPSFEVNNKSAREDMEFVRSEVKRLESLGCIMRVENRPRCVLPLSSVFSKKKRLVVDGSRCLNPYLKHRRVRLQDLRDVPEMVRSGFFMMTEDLDSGYWHLRIKPVHRTFLGIHIVEEDGSVSFFVWKVMFLGISDAVFIFTAMLKPVRIFLQNMGIPNILYIDDHLTMGESELKARANNAIANGVLKQAGWVVSPTKSQGPSSRLVFLGLEVCSVEQKFFIPEKKMVRLLGSLDSVLNHRKVSVRSLASLVGSLQSCALALGPVVRLMTRNVYCFIMENVIKFSWGYHVVLTDSCRQELQFWVDNLSLLNGYHFSPKLSMVDIDFDIISDASQVGVFGYQFSHFYEVILRRMFSAEERKGSSTLRELLALRDIYMSSAAERYSGKTVRHLTDNQAVPRIVSVGSKNVKLQEIVLSLFHRCRQLNITLLVEWRSREDPLLVHADLGSKMFDQSSFSLDFSSFGAILEFFSHLPLDVDCMAESWNRKCNIFFSRFPDPMSSGINFFAQRLQVGTSYYAFPPPSLITAVLHHLQSFQVSGLILVPVWPSASFWNNLVPDGVHLACWAKQFLIFKPVGFVCDPNVTSHTFKNPPTFQMLAIEFDFGGVMENVMFASNRSQKICLEFGCDKCT